MKTERKLIVSGVLLAALVGGAFFLNQKKKKDVEKHAAVATDSLPKIALEKAKVTRLVVKSKDHEEIVLEKKDDKWRVTKPLDALASATTVDSVLNNLEKLSVTSVISANADDTTYAKYELDEKHATHVQAFAGSEALLDMSFGKGGSRGTMSRIGAEAKVYGIDGYSTFLYGKDVGGWRDKDILKFEDGNAIAIEVENKNGRFSFTKNADKWGGAFYARDAKKGTLEAKPAKWEKFDEAKVKDMLTAYKNLVATDFAKAGDDTGIDKAVDEGGLVRFKFKDGNGDFALKIGKIQQGENRYLAKDGGDGTVFVVSSWTSRWAVGKMDQFSKTEENKKDAKGGDDDEGGGELPDLSGGAGLGD